MEYEQLLSEAYKKVKVVETSSDRFNIPKVKGFVSGKCTIISNIKEIADYIRRPVENLTRYVEKSLGLTGKIEKDKWTIKGRINSNQINEKIEIYVREFVICNECKKPDTEIISEKGIKAKHCLACGAKSPVKSKF